MHPIVSQPNSERQDKISILSLLGLTLLLYLNIVRDMLSSLSSEAFIGCVALSREPYNTRGKMLLSYRSGLVAGFPSVFPCILFKDAILPHRGHLNLRGPPQVTHFLISNRCFKSTLRPVDISAYLHLKHLSWNNLSKFTIVISMDVISKSPNKKRPGWNDHPGL